MNAAKKKKKKQQTKGNSVVYTTLLLDFVVVFLSTFFSPEMTSIAGVVQTHKHIKHTYMHFQLFLSIWVTSHKLMSITKKQQ